MRPQVDYLIWWAQVGNDLKVDKGTEEAGPEMEEGVGGDFLMQLKQSIDAEGESRT